MPENAPLNFGLGFRAAGHGCRPATMSSAAPSAPAGAAVGIAAERVPDHFRERDRSIAGIVVCGGIAFMI